MARSRHRTYEDSLGAFRDYSLLKYPEEMLSTTADKAVMTKLKARLAKVRSINAEHMCWGHPCKNPQPEGMHEEYSGKRWVESKNLTRIPGQYEMSRKGAYYGKFFQSLLNLIQKLYTYSSESSTPRLIYS